jgi:hypothetical protein
MTRDELRNDRRDPLAQREHLLRLWRQYRMRGQPLCAGLYRQEHLWDLLLPRTRAHLQAAAAGRGA